MTALLCLCSLWCAAQDGADAHTIHLFYSPSCPPCHQVRTLVQGLQAKHPGLSIKEYNATEPDSTELMVEFYARYQVPEDEWRGTFALFVGDRWWTSTVEALDELGDALAEMPPAAAKSRPLPEDAERAQDTLIALFEQFGVLAVAGAGLADGVNPCAFAALVFLISYLSFTERSGAQILATGVLFAAGVFIAYLGVGIGLFRGLQALSGFALVSKLLYPAMALGTLVLTGYSLRDYLRARAGQAKDMTLTLPRGMIRLSHGTIRKLMGGPGFLALAFVAGLAISLLELLCTGQIYLPTIMYVASTEALRARALGLLLLYVSLFTLPIIALTFVAYAGVSSERLAGLAKEHTAGTKLALTIVFAGLTVYLVYFSVRLFLP